MHAISSEELLLYTRVHRFSITVEFFYEQCYLMRISLNIW